MKHRTCLLAGNKEYVYCEEIEELLDMFIAKETWSMFIRNIECLRLLAKTFYILIVGKYLICFPIENIFYVYLR